MLFECVANVSEGRRPEIVAQLADVVRRTPGMRLLDSSADADHNRSVFTFVGDGPALEQAVLALVERAIAHIDLRTHLGEHPRIGAVDVVPFVPLTGATMADAVGLATRTGRAIAERFGVPVYLYEAAAAHPSRRALQDIRRGGFEGLAAKMASPGWTPDFGPATPHPTAGASAVGARPLLIAYNINLAADRLDIAKAIAAAVRASGGGLPFVKALGLRLADRGIVQVSINLTNYERTSMAAVFDAVTREAARRGVSVLESEVIGLIPAAALRPGDETYLKLKGFTPRQVLETRLVTDDW